MFSFKSTIWIPSPPHRESRYLFNLSGLQPNYDYVLDHKKNNVKITFTLPCSLPIKCSDGDVDILSIQYPEINKPSHSNTFL